MMTKTHVVGGMASAIAIEAIARHLGYTMFHSAISFDLASGLTIAVAIVLTGIASILPDLDHAKSKVSNANLMTWLVSIMIRKLTGHRGATHTLLMCACLVWITHLIHPTGAVWVLIGYLSHLILDMMTIRGLKVLKPFSSRAYHVLPRFFRIRTGGQMERFFRLACWLVVVIAGGNLLI